MSTPENIDSAGHEQSVAATRSGGAEVRSSPRSAATRERLLVAGRQAFARLGLAGTNLAQDILQPSGVSVGSFYHQFRNKTELLLAILADDSRDLQFALRRVQETAPGRTLVDIARDSYAATFAVVDDHADTMRILFRESAVDDPEVQQFAHAEQRRWIEILTHNFTRIAAADHETREIALAAELISVLTTGALAHYLGLPEPERVAARERLVEGLARLTLGGLPALGFDEATLAAAARPLSSTANPNSASDLPDPAGGGEV